MRLRLCLANKLLLFCLCLLGRQALRDRGLHEPRQAPGPLLAPRYGLKHHDLNNSWLSPHNSSLLLLCLSLVCVAAQAVRPSARCRAASTAPSRAATAGHTAAAPSARPPRARRSRSPTVSAGRMAAVRTQPLLTTHCGRYSVAS